jgi:hypothetical protein
VWSRGPAEILRNHRTLLSSWFKAKGVLSSGAVEGFNNVDEDLLLAKLELDLRAQLDNSIRG